MTFEQMLAQAKQLYNGTQELQRVYNGETMVWNRYNWEKWSCDSKTTTETKYREVILSTTVSAHKDYVPTDAYVTYGFYLFTGDFGGFGARSGYSLAQLASQGYSAVYQITGGRDDGMAKYDLTSLNGDYYSAYVYTSESYTETSVKYSKGTTQYADVNGLKGDYPSGGRASDGYWYVAKGAVYFGGS